MGFRGRTNLLGLPEDILRDKKWADALTVKSHKMYIGDDTDIYTTT